MGLLKDISPLHAEIVDGKYDEHLDTLQQALAYRVKVAMRDTGLRAGVKVRFIDAPESGRLAKREATVKKINKKTVSVYMNDNSWESYRVSPSLLELVKS